MTALIHARIEHWPLFRPFAISRGTLREAVTLVVEICSDGVTGRGESVPYERFDETPETSLAAVEALRSWETPLERTRILDRMPAGAARNAIDCALWDLEAKRKGKSVWELAGLPPPQPVSTAYTISLGSPEEMRQQAAEARNRPLLKIKMGGAAEEEAARLQAVRIAAPESRLVVDANEGWTAEILSQLAPSLVDSRVELVEQPLPQEVEYILADLPRPVPICADESCHTRSDLDRIQPLYDFINVKLDKTGGLTEALALCQEARKRGLGIFIGCMMAGSLAIAPSLLLAPLADFVDLDGPIYIRHDRIGGVRAEGSVLHPPEVGFWG